MSETDPGRIASIKSLLSEHDASDPRDRAQLLASEQKRLVRIQLHARNVDKQRRRLLAAKLVRLASAKEDAAQAHYSLNPYAPEFHMAKYKKFADRANRLRTIAARLRGTE